MRIDAAICRSRSVSDDAQCSPPPSNGEESILRFKCNRPVARRRRWSDLDAPSEEGKPLSTARGTIASASLVFLADQTELSQPSRASQIGRSGLRDGPSSRTATAISPRCIRLRCVPVPRMASCQPAAQFIERRPYIECSNHGCARSSVDQQKTKLASDPLRSRGGRAHPLPRRRPHRDRLNVVEAPSADALNRKNALFAGSDAAASTGDMPH